VLYHVAYVGAQIERWNKPVLDAVVLNSEVIGGRGQARFVFPPNRDLLASSLSGSQNRPTTHVTTCHLRFGHVLHDFPYCWLLHAFHRPISRTTVAEHQVDCCWHKRERSATRVKPMVSAGNNARASSGKTGDYQMAIQLKETCSYSVFLDLRALVSSRVDTEFDPSD
jgi:hypothetical protein